MNTIGIDIGGTQLRAAVVSESYELLDVYKTDNDRALTCEQNMDRLLDYVCTVCDGAGGIGIGSPGPLNVRTGTIVRPPNMFGWDGFGIVRHTEQRTGLRAVLNNDGNVAALAEAVLGSGQGCESVVFVGLSTGVGGGYVYRGEIVSGAHCNAAEWWNMMVSDDYHCHKNANPGSLNEQCSGSGLAMWASEHYGEATDARTLIERHGAGDPHATRILEHGAEMLGRGFANIMCAMDPDVIVVGGSVAVHNPFFLEWAVRKAQPYLIDPDSLHVKEASFGDDAGLIGAALLLREKSGS
ncbi:MAG: ROK family protein [Clostridia bacterium]|nr:ROK family protein [Clostridia bacterium]